MNISRRYVRRLEEELKNSNNAIIALQGFIQQLYNNQGMLDKKVNQAYALARACAQALIENEIEDGDYISTLANELEEVLSNPPKNCYTPAQVPESQPQSPPKAPRAQSDGKVIQFPVKPQETNP